MFLAPFYYFGRLRFGFSAFRFALLFFLLAPTEDVFAEKTGNPVFLAAATEPSNAVDEGGFAESSTYPAAVSADMGSVRDLEAEAVAQVESDFGRKNPSLEPVFTLEVTARRLPPIAREDSSAAATVIGRERLSEPAIQLQEAINELPGVRTTDSGGFSGFSTANIRGTSSQQADVYLDGVPLNRVNSGLANLSAVPVGNIERVEVYRGSTPLSFSSSAIGGVINIRTRRPRARELEFGLGAGSFGTRTASLYAGGSGEKVWGVAGLHIRSTKGNFTYWNDRGTAYDLDDDYLATRLNNHSDQLDGLLKAGYETDTGLEFSLTESIYGLRGGLPGNGLRQATRADRDDFRSITNLTVEQLDWPLRDAVLRLQLYYTWQRERQRDPIAEFGMDRNDATNLTQAPGANFYASLPLLDWLTWGAFASFDYEDYLSRDKLRPTPIDMTSLRRRSSIATQPGIYIEPLKVSLVPTIRYEYVDSRQHGRLEFGRPVADPPPAFEELLSWRLGAVYEPVSWLQLKANASSANRIPSLYELFGDSAYVLPNPDLLAESGVSFDVGANFLLNLRDGNDFILAEMFVFHHDIENFIQFIRASKDTVVARNLDAAKISGFEAGLQADLWSWLAVRASYTFLDAIQVSRAPSRNGKFLPLRPASQSYVRTELYRTTIPYTDRVGLYGELNWQAGNFVDPANFIAIPARTTIGAGASACFLACRLNASLRATNLTNKQINDLIGFPLPGRGFFAEIRYAVY